MLMMCSLDSSDRLLACSLVLPALNSPTALSSSRRVGLPFDPSRSAQKQSRRMRLDGSESPYALVKTSVKALSQSSAPAPGGGTSGLNDTLGSSPTASTCRSSETMSASFLYSLFTSMMKHAFVLIAMDCRIA